MYLVVIIITTLSCSKKDFPSNTTPPVNDELIGFSIQTLDTVNTNTIKSDSILITVTITSKIPTNGITCSIKVMDSSNNLIYSNEVNSNKTSVSLVGKGFQIGKKYTTILTVTSNNNSNNTLTKKIFVQRKRVYKDYKKTSYEMFNSTSWISSDSVFENGIKVTKYNPLLLPSTIQIDIDGDGLEDLFTYDSYSLNSNPTPNPPPSIFMNNGTRYDKVYWTGPSIQDPHGIKSCIGDFDNDSLPDIFSPVSVDPPGGGFPTLTDNCHLIFNSSSGFNKVLEFNDLGFWYTGCSGDIDKDGDLDIIKFNFHFLSNGIKSKILWNNGNGNFTYDTTGIGSLPLVTGSELIDVNHDTMLDLIIYSTRPNYTPCPCTYISDVFIMWGNGNGFDLNNSISFIAPQGFSLENISSLDLDADNINEIILAGNDGNGSKYWLELFKSYDNGLSFQNKTNDFFDMNYTTSRFDLIRAQDIDNNGLIDLFSPDKKDNIRWEWDGSKFIKK